MRAPSLAFVLAVVVTPLLVDGCLSDDNSDNSAVDAGTYDGYVPIVTGGDGGTPDSGGPTVDATLPDANPVDATPIDAAIDEGPPLDAGTANLRFVNLVPDLPSAVDVCAAAAGGALQGPFLKAAGVTAGLAYGEITRYVTVPLATHVQVRIVAANAADCSNPLVPDLTALPITIAQRATVALLGSLSDASHFDPALAAFPDDELTGLPTFGARVRIIHAAPGSPATDFEFGAGPTYVWPQHTAVPFGSAIAPATMAPGALATDANGYFTEPLNEVQITATHTTDVASFVPQSRAVSAFFVGLEGSSSDPAGMLVCDDTATPAGFTSACALRTGPPTFTQFRLLHASPTVPALDFCFQIQGATTMFGPMLQQNGLAAGVSYLQLTGDLALVPTDTQYAISILAPGQACAAPPLARLNTLSFFGQPGVTEQTYVFAEGWEFEATQGVAYGADALYTSAPSITDGGVQIIFSSMDFNNQANFNLSFALYDTPEAGVETYVQGFPPLGGLGSVSFTLTPGTHAFRVEDLDAGTTTVTRNGAVFGPNQTWLLQYYDVSDAGVGLTRCNLALPDAGTVTTCAP